MKLESRAGVFDVICCHNLIHFHFKNNTTSYSRSGNITDIKMVSILLVLAITFICVTLACAGSSPFDEIKFENLGKRILLKNITGDQSPLNCAQRCKRERRCSDIAYHNYLGKKNTGECILLTKMKSPTCVLAADGMHYVTGDHSGQYNIERLCKRTGKFDGKYDVIEPVLFEPSQVTDQEIIFYSKKPQFGKDNEC